MRRTWGSSYLANPAVQDKWRTTLFRFQGGKLKERATDNVLLDDLHTYPVGFEVRGVCVDVCLDGLERVVVDRNDEIGIDDSRELCRLVAIHGITPTDRREEDVRRH